MRKLNKIFALVSLLLVGYACSDDFLDRAPLDQPSSATFYDSEAELILAVNSAYKNISFKAEGLGGGVPNNLMLDVASDVAWYRSGSSLKNLANGSADPTVSAAKKFWTECYKGISKCNNLLDNMNLAQEVASPELFDRIEGEARFLRAYYYAYLVELYGDVPLVTSLLSADEAFVAKTPKSEVVSFIYSELDLAASKLPETYTGDDQGRATRGAALALKSRIALYNGEYAMASTAANQVMTSGVYSLYNDYRDLFTTAGEGNDEVILSAGYVNPDFTHGTHRVMGSRRSGGWSVLIPTRDLVDSYETINGLPIDEDPTYDPVNPYENRDPRLRQSILTPGDSWIGIQFEVNPDSTKVTDFNNNKEIKNLEVTNSFATFTGFLWKKYQDEEKPDNLQKIEIDMILMRYAEVLLNYAEAKIEANDIDATVLDAINQVRTRPSVGMPAVTTTDKAELLRIVRRERKVEFAGEGLRLFDIRRWSIAENVIPGKLLGRPNDASFYLAPPVPDIDDVTGHVQYADESLFTDRLEVRAFNPARDYLWPIPQSEMDVNPNLEQNPGY